MRKIIVVISADFINAKQIAEEIMGKTYADISNVKLALGMLLEKEEGEEVEEPRFFTIENLLIGLNNDESVSTENSFFTQLNLEM